MINKSPFSRWLTLGGLLLLVTALLLPWPGMSNLLISLPVALLLITGLRPAPRWGGWVAVLMIPYLCIAVGELMVAPGNRWSNGIVAGLSTLVFFAAMDFVRRSGSSLR